MDIEFKTYNLKMARDMWLSYCPFRNLFKSMNNMIINKRIYIMKINLYLQYNKKFMYFGTTLCEKSLLNGDKFR